MRHWAGEFCCQHQRLAVTTTIKLEQKEQVKPVKNAKVLRTMTQTLRLETPEPWVSEKLREKSCHCQCQPSRLVTCRAAGQDVGLVPSFQKFSILVYQFADIQRALIGKRNSFQSLYIAPWWLCLLFTLASFLVCELPPSQS